MKRTLIAALSAFGVSVYAFAPIAASAQNNQQPSRMGQWEADQQTLLDAKLAGMKAGLQLTPDQEKLWAPFESAVKDAAKARAEAMSQMMQARRRGERMSPIDHLDAIADRLSRGADDVRKIAAAAKPLYASLDDSQKRTFGVLGRLLTPERRRGAAMMRGQRGEGQGEGQGDSDQ
jgi:LTXXQ motif family protein